MQRLSGDFETASLANLKRTGAYKYARDPSTRIICFAWAIGEEDPSVWFPDVSPPPNQLLSAIAAGAEFHAWNAMFEFCVWNEVGRAHGLPPLPIERFHCTMARGLFWGVPAKLEHAAPVVGVNQQKDKQGHDLMMRMARPRAFDDAGRPRWWDREDPERRVRLGEYCRQDVRAERAIGRRLPPMSPAERQVWLLDARMNLHGLKVDLEAVDAMQRVVDSEMRRLGGLMAEATEGAVTSVTQTGRLLAYLQNDGLKIDSLDKRELPDIFKEPLTEPQRHILELYQEGAKTSTAKLKAMRDFLCDDGRVRNLVQYGGALRTLRWAGRGVQIQNYPRPSKTHDVKWELRDILNGADAETIDLVHGWPMDVVSQCLRGCYVAEQGRTFAVCDYSAVEARVVAWLADEQHTLEIFRQGRDIYAYTAYEIGSSSRQLGKVLVLACGFGMGPVRFVITAAAYGLVISKEDAKTAVYRWRDLNKKTRNFWYDVDRAVREVINEKTITPQWVGKINFRMGKPGGEFAQHLLMQLPSGRYIVYRHPSIDEIIPDEDGYADVETKIRYDGLRPNRQWSRIPTWGGKLVENATQAVARDLLADAILRLDDGSDDLAVTIHDELIAEPELARAEARLAQMKQVMSRPPGWAFGLPIKAEGALMQRYGK
jgi:DNA polymerase bacteriophage-type